VLDLNHDYFEKILCSRALTDSAYLAAIVDFIKPEYFKDKNIAAIFTIISKFYQQRDKLPTLTEVKAYITTDSLKNSFKTVITEIKNIDKNIDKDELYANTEKFLKEKAVYNTMLSLANEISTGTINTGEALTKFEKACNITLTTDMGIDLYGNIDTIVNDLLNVQKMIPSTWPWLDEVLGGGFLEQGRALYVFAGETNIGKSIFLGNIATNISRQGKNVLLITLEMSELLYAKRLCSNVSKIPLSSLSINTSALKQAIVEEKARGNGSIFIKEFPPATVTPNQIKAFIKKITDAGICIDAIVIDYLNLLHSPSGSNSYERVKIIAEQVRAISYIFNCPVISATQLNRSSYGAPDPGLGTISESIGLAATADVIVSLYQNEEDRELGVIRMGMMKNRYGMRGHTQAMRIDYSTLTISQSEDDFTSDEADGVLDVLRSFAD